MKLIDAVPGRVRRLAERQGIPATLITRANGAPEGVELALFRPGHDRLLFRAPRDFSRTDWRGFRTLAVEIENRDADEVKVEVVLAGSPGERDMWKTATFTALVPPGSRTVWRLPLQQLRYSATWGSPWGWPRQKGLGCLESTGLTDTRRVGAIRIGFASMPRTGRLGAYGVEDPKWATPARIGLYGLRLEDKVAPEGWVDRYGQSTAVKWPGKAKTDAALLRADARERAGMDGARPFPGRDSFQAWTRRPPLRATGFFRVRQVDGRWWLVAPNGRLYYATGMDCVICGVDGRLDGSVLSAHSWLPSRAGRFAEAWSDRRPRTGLSMYRANLIRKWGAGYRRRYLDRAMARQLAWGFTSIGNWSDHDLFKYRMLPYFSVGPSYGGMKTPYVAKLIHDAFDPGFDAGTPGAMNLAGRTSPARSGSFRLRCGRRTESPHRCLS